MAAIKNQAELIGKIVLATAKLKSIQCRHDRRCQMLVGQVDAGCSCGAEQNNALIKEALEELKLEE